MTCEYLIEKKGIHSCLAYGSLEQASSEKILECESNSMNCFKCADKFLKEKDKEKGFAGYLISLVF